MTNDLCKTCNGSGEGHYSDTICGDCKGSGTPPTVIGYCGSQKCAINIRSVRGVEKKVPRGTTDCPDCNSALKIGKYRHTIRRTVAEKSPFKRCFDL